MNPNQIYEQLLLSFGQQGWWPIGGKDGLSRSGKAVKSLSESFSPHEWEICIGAILTQNTNWSNVEKALAGMRAARITSVSKVLYCEDDKLEQAIRPSGFYKQKAGRLKGLAEFVTDFGGFREFSKTVTREELLSVRGLGPETVDSILLYALNRPVFVIDAYTRRVFTRLGFNLEDRGRKFGRVAPRKPREEYELWRWFFESSLSRDENRVNVYKEFHALIVELAKRHCKAKPVCKGCPLEQDCMKVF